MIVRTITCFLSIGYRNNEYCLLSLLFGGGDADVGWWDGDLFVGGFCVVLDEGGQEVRVLLADGLRGDVLKE